MIDGHVNLSCRIDLPAHFRPEDTLAFHRRDTERVAEYVDGDRMAKGLLWQGRTALLEIVIGPRTASAILRFDRQTDDRRPGGHALEALELEKLVSHMLGLRQPVERFEQHYQGHPQLGRLIRNNRGLRIPQAATPFEAVSWAIIGQQISVRAAVSIRRRLIRSTGLEHSSGLWCYPDAHRVLKKGEPALRSAGLSAGKSAALLALARGIATRDLPLDDWRQSPDPDAIRTALLAIRGIGPWTVNYTLLRGFNSLDGSLHGDVAVRRNLQKLLGSEVPISERDAARWLEDFSPWRALVAAHLWAAADVVA